MSRQVSINCGKARYSHAWFWRVAFSQTLENDTVSSVGSTRSSRKEQATSVSFVNIPPPSAKASSPPVTRSHAASRGKYFGFTCEPYQNHLTQLKRRPRLAISPN